MIFNWIQYQVFRYRKWRGRAAVCIHNGQFQSISAIYKFNEGIKK